MILLISDLLLYLQDSNDNYSHSYKRKISKSSHLTVLSSDKK